MPAIACHCHSCQKRTGSAFNLALIIPTDALKLSGDLTPWTRITEQGNRNTRYSCASCGNIIYGIGEDKPELAKLQAGTLEDTSEVEAEVHIWAKYKQPWVVLSEKTRPFETQPDDPLELMQAAIDYRI
ncbi:MAG: hypothetical protein ACI9JM_001562 [Halioglobus sp.]|jgi:hypothetical protein